MGRRNRKRLRESDEPQGITKPQMRVVMPYTKILKEVTDALDSSGYEYEMRDVSASDTTYFDLIEELWDAGETFATVEHDIVINADTLSGFAACGAQWCVALYPYRVTGHYCGLGCCKISRSMIARHPAAMKAIATWEDPGHPPKNWCRLDGWLRQYLEEHGEKMHVHYPPLVQHLGNNWPSHGCVKPEETT